MLALTQIGEGVTVDASNQELQQYLFDLQGYLVIHNVLGAAEVAELNRLIDAQRLPSPRGSIRFGSAAGKHGRIRMHKGQTMGAMHADYGASALNSFTRPG